MPERVRIVLGRLLELDISSAKQLRSAAGFPSVRVELPATSVRPLQMMLRTEVTIFESIILRDSESGITSPHLVGEIDTLEPGSAVVFRYEPGSMPGFRAQRAEREGRASRAEKHPASREIFLLATAKHACEEIPGTS